MLQQLSSLLDHLSEYLAHRKGLLPLLGLVLVVVNFAFQLLPPNWFAQTNCFLHLGLVLAIVGFMLARAL